MGASDLSAEQPGLLIPPAAEYPVGIIDSDYFYSDNQGHMFVKMTNDTNEGRTVELSAGTGFAQGIFLPFGITVDDDCKDSRNGGFGSTDAR